MKRFASGTAILLALVAPMLGQQDRNTLPVFRSTVDLVQVDAYVTDSQGNPVSGLTVDDFEVREDGRSQSIAYFLPFNIPIEAPREGSSSAASVEADVQSNEPREGRLYVIAVDELRPENGLRTRVFLRQFVERHMGGSDVATVVLIGKGRRIDTQEFTSNRRLLLRAIDLVSGWPAEAPPITGISGPLAVGFSRPSRDRLYALRDLVEFLARIPSRRKAMLLLTEDVGCDFQNAIETPSSAAALACPDIGREVARAALRANVAIYPIDPNRLSLADTVSGEFAGGPSVEMERRRRQLEMSRRTNLRSLGDVTGGFALVSSNDVEGAFARLVRENSTYYSLGYYSTQDRADGRFRRLDVRVRRPGLRVHTISGYLAPTERVAEVPRKPGVADALSHPLAVSGLPMRVVAAPYRGQGEEAAIAATVEIDGSALEFDRKGDTFTAQLEVGYIVSAATGALPPVTYRMDLALKPDSYEKARKTGVRILLEPPGLRPGNYQIRFGVAQIGRRFGSVLYDLEVPEFTKRALVLSGVSLTSVETSAQGVATGKNVLTEALPGPMTATREFTAADRVAVYTEVYDNITDANPHTVTVRAELRTLTGEVVRTVADERSSTLLNRRQGGYGFLFEIPLNGIAAGAYAVHVDATANAADRPRETRAIPIQVR
ncbi:MAG: VWA domain-containing protein [Vicinamibacterales bacterium]